MREQDAAGEDLSHLPHVWRARRPERGGESAPRYRRRKEPPRFVHPPAVKVVLNCVNQYNNYLQNSFFNRHIKIYENGTDTIGIIDFCTIMSTSIIPIRFICIENLTQHLLRIRQ